jgi:hypothetical protein
MDSQSFEDFFQLLFIELNKCERSLDDLRTKLGAVQLSTTAELKLRNIIKESLNNSLLSLIVLDDMINDTEGVRNSKSEDEIITKTIN